jgi:hypothetical protein
MTDDLMNDEKGLISTALLHGAFPPKPEYLADCERLRARGWLDRTVIDDETVVFSLSMAGVTALELGVPLGEGSAN